VQLGFEVIPGAELSSVLHWVLEEEARRGLDPSRRVAMRYRFAEHRGNESLWLAQNRIEPMMVPPCDSPSKHGN